MKKIIAFLLCVAVICTLSVSAFATSSSPVAKEEVKVIVRGADVKDHTADTQFTVKGDGIVEVSANLSKGTLTGWSIYKVVNGQTVAAENGVDFEIVAGGLDQPTVSLKLKNDVIICADYNGQKTAPGTFDQGGDSPKTADYAIVFAAISMIAAAAMVFSAKKVTSK